MQSQALTPDQYINELDNDRSQAMIKLREICQKNLVGFQECMQYGMISYVVPLSKFPQGYHCTPNTPLPFVSIASQKNFISFYHMGLYADQDLITWFQDEYKSYPARELNSSNSGSLTKLDMGKSCIRFKKIDQIPYQLISDLLSKITIDQRIDIYNKNIYKKINS